MFNNRERNLRDSKQNINEIMNLLDEIIVQTNEQPYLYSVVSSLRNILNENNATDDKEALNCDLIIISNLRQITSSVRTSNYLNALNQLETLLNSEEIKKRCCLLNPSRTLDLPKIVMKDMKRREKMTKGVVTKTEDPFDFLYSTLYDEYNRLIETVAKLEKAYKKANKPNERALKEYLGNKLNISRMRLNNTKELIDLYHNEIVRDEIAKNIGQLINAKNTLYTRKFGLSEADFDLLMQDLANAKEEINRRRSQGEAGAEVLGTPVDNFVSEEPKTNVVNITSGYAQSTPKATTSAYTSNPKVNVNVEQEREFENLKNNPDDIDYEDLFERIKEGLRELNRTYNYVDNKQNQVNEEMKSIDEQLKDLILKRKASPKSDYLMIDSEIDSLESRRHTCERQIKTCINQKAQINEKRRILEETKMHAESRAREAESEYSFSTQDILDISMGLKGFINEENEKLGEVKVAGSIVDDTDIDINTFSASEYARDKQEEESADDDKYAELEKRYGIKA